MSQRSSESPGPGLRPSHHRVNLHDRACQRWPGAGLLWAAALLVTAAPSGTAQYTLLASHTPTGDGGNANSSAPRLSADGQLVAFTSVASNLVLNDTNGVTDVFTWDRISGAVKRVSVSSAGVQANSFCSTPALSADGRFVVFASSANNLVTGDTNGVADVFRHDRTNGVTLRVSTNSSGGEAHGASGAPWISTNGRYVAFTSTANDLVAGDTNGVQDVFIKDMATGIVTLESRSSGGVLADAACQRPVLSGDARKLAYHSAASTLTPADNNGLDDVFVKDRLTGLVQRVSTGPLGLISNGASRNASLSLDGSLVAFESAATNLDSADANGMRDIFLFHFGTGLCSLVAQSDDGHDASLSGDGLRVAFSTSVALHPLDDNGQEDVYLKVLAGGLARLNLSSEGMQGNGSSGLASLDGEGRHAAFTSHATNLVAAGTSGQQVYLRDTVSAWTQLGLGTAGVSGLPQLIGAGTLLPSSPTSLSLSNAAPSTASFLVMGLLDLSVPFKSGTLVPSPDLILAVPTSGAGTWVVPFDWPAENWSGLTLYAQAWIKDPAGPAGWAASGGLQMDVP